ncbi:hypothetical protein HII31_10120 [Pseudocercospora fuligena]|uniref:Uncharacterized protein n=1 Tax=Pseudocercospora fuligena TaxID=685502 RepID=A0A8H6VDM0_9PEZI|nr:hypothetical protein HII31_10120 [Pseudocercospora fuligena]
MPLLYGEGAKAFIRLQETVLAATMDHSLLAWTPYALEQCHLLLAPDCYCFRLATDLVSKADPSVDPDFAITNRGLRMTLPMSSSGHPGLVLARLQCRRWSDKSLFALRLRYVGPVEPKAFTRGPKPYEVVRTISGTDERYWIEGCRSKWVDLVMLRTPLNVTIPVELPTGVRVVSAGVGQIGRYWHSRLLEFSIPQSVFEPAFIEVMDLVTRKKKVLSLLRWRLRDIVVGWTSWRAHWTHETEGLSLGEMILAAARKDNTRAWRIPGTTEVLKAEVWATGMGDLPQERDLPETTAILRLIKEPQSSDFASLWSSYPEEVRTAFTMRMLSGIAAASQAPTTNMKDVLRAALVDDGALLRELYAADISGLVAELREIEVAVEGWTLEKFQGGTTADMSDITIDDLD